VSVGHHRCGGRLCRLVLAAAGGGFATLAFGAGAASAYWSLSDTSPTGGAAAADAIVTAPGAPSVPTGPATSRDIDVAFGPATFRSGSGAVTEYRVQRYAEGATSPSASFLCNAAGSATTVACTDTDVPDGRWQYTETPLYATNWQGAESERSAGVLVDLTPPSVTVTAPVDGRTYDAATWTVAGPMSGTASAATFPVQSVAVSLQQGNQGCWNGGGIGSSAFDEPCDHYVVVQGTSSWQEPFTVAQLGSGGTYTLRVQVTDSAGIAWNDLAQVTFVDDPTSLEAATSPGPGTGLPSTGT